MVRVSVGVGVWVGVKVKKKTKEMVILSLFRSNFLCQLHVHAGRAK